MYALYTVNGLHVKYEANASRLLAYLMIKTVNREAVGLVLSKDNIIL